MSTGENEQGLRKILDLTRLSSIVLLGLHFYYVCYMAFEAWQLTARIMDRVMGSIIQTGLFNSFHLSKGIALVLLAISLLGARGRKDEKLSYQAAFAYILTGLAFYFFSYWV